MPLKLSPYQAHCERWKNGCGSDQCADVRNIALCRGKLPCDVMFIGEAPGESEDVLGEPFIGPAGRLLDKMIEMARRDRTFRIAWTNLVGCIPREDGGDNKADAPSKGQIESCRPRLREIVKMARPRLVVYVGSLSEKHGPELLKGILGFQTCKIIHPAAILRSRVEDQGLKYQEAIVTLASALRDIP